MIKGLANGSESFREIEEKNLYSTLNLIFCAMGQKPEAFQGHRKMYSLQLFVDRRPNWVKTSGNRIA